jgi:DNA-binding NtrC family response regulator
MKKAKTRKARSRTTKTRCSKAAHQARMQARILVVDDENDFTATIQRTLEEEGYRADAALSGAEAVEMHRKRAYDLALVDLKMPDMTGLELMQYLKVRDRNIAVILMTAYGSLAVGIEALKKGASDYLPKPFKLATLLEKVEAALKHRARFLDEQAHLPVDEI